MTILLDNVNDQKLDKFIGIPSNHFLEKQYITNVILRFYSVIRR
jgi:hypothetical protein